MTTRKDEMLNKEKQAPAMSDEEQQMWDEAGIGQPPSRGDPVGAITKFLFIVGGIVVAAFVIAALAR